MVTDTLWTLDPHHKQFTDRFCALPSMFSDFQGLNDWQRKKQKPQLSHNEHMKQLHDRQSPVRSPDDSFSVTPIAASSEPTKSCYLDVQEALSNLEEYEPVFLND